MVDFSAALRKAKEDIQAELASDPGLVREVTAGDSEFVPENYQVNLPVNILSLERVKPQFEDFKKNALQILADAQAVEITDADRQEFAVSLGGSASKLIKKVEAQRKDVTQNAEDFVAAVKNIAALIVEPLKKAVLITKEKNNQYTAKLELERREAEQKANEAAKKLQAEIDAGAAKAGVPAPQVVAPSIPKTETKVRTESGTTAYTVSRWVGTIDNPGDVPREYCTPDIKLINDAIKQGVREIKGVTIKEVKDTRYR